MALGIHYNEHEEIWEVVDEDNAVELGGAPTEAEALQLAREIARDLHDAEGETFWQIEEESGYWIEEGFAPADSEPGEWLLMEHPDGRVVLIEPDGPTEYPSRDAFMANR